MPKGLKGFQKGHKLGLGKPCPPDVRDKIREANLGKHVSPETIEKIRAARSRQIMSVESQKKKSATMRALGDKHWMRRPEVREKISRANRGKPRFDMRGDKHPQWKGGITPQNRKIRNSLEYSIWRRAVLERDDYKCIWCGSAEKLEADHIKRFSLYPELRFAIDNGRTLCFKCHKSTYGLLY